MAQAQACILASVLDLDSPAPTHAPVLRIDPTATATRPYRIPPSNPFVGQSPRRGEIWLYGVRNPSSISFDSQTGDYADLVKKGIIDPTKVVRTAIQNAASVAALLITTEAMVAELPKKAGAGPAMPPGGGMGGMGGMDF